MKLVAVLVLALCVGSQVRAAGPLKTFDDLDAAGIGKGYRVPPSQTIDYNALMNNLNSLPEPPKRELGPIDRWRFESCQSDAAKAPTELGVKAGLRVCREKFGQ